MTVFFGTNDSGGGRRLDNLDNKYDKATVASAMNFGGRLVPIQKSSMALDYNWLSDSSVELAHSDDNTNMKISYKLTNYAQVGVDCDLIVAYYNDKDAVSSKSFLCSPLNNGIRPLSEPSLKLDIQYIFLK